MVDFTGANVSILPTDKCTPRAGGSGLRTALIELANGGETDDGLGYGGSGADIPKAAAPALSRWDDEQTRVFLRQTILNWSRSGAGSPSIGTAAVWSLASYGDREAMISLLDIKRRIRHKNLLKRLGALQNSPITHSTPRCHSLCADPAIMKN